MNVPLYDTIGLQIYRELMKRESEGAANWHVNYGKEALQKAPDASKMINLGKFSKFASVPMPLDVQLKAIRAERQKETDRVAAYEKQVYPTKSEHPVSELSLRWYGDAAWHTQPKQEAGAPSTYTAYEPKAVRWNRRVWDVDRVQYVHEGLLPAHVSARLKAEGAEK